MQDKITILDFGGQYTHLIASKIRRLNVYSEIKEPNVSLKDLAGSKGIILSGGPYSVYDTARPKFNSKIFELGIPVLGLCYGHQLIAQELGGKVKPGKTREFGKAKLKVLNQENLFLGLKNKETVWMSHGDSVVELPVGFEVIASTSDCSTAAVFHPQKKLFGLQFHPEVTHTPKGLKILENFIKICGCKQDWTTSRFINQTIKKIRENIGQRKVFLLVSGGVDSTVAFALLNKALGSKKVYGLHIDNGLLRKNEAQVVKRSLLKVGFNNFHIADASREFLKALRGTVNPEKKRQIIGKLFIDVWQKETQRLKLNPKEWVLAQGTIYPDTIETAKTRHADRIKTHHNRVAAVQKLLAQGALIEPLDELYKDEVREVGLELGLPNELIWRHPFPGPGLAVRILCADKEEKIEKVSEQKIKDVCQKFSLEARVLPLKSVGVQGDQRTYAYTVALSGEGNWDILEKVSTKLTNTLKGINRAIWLVEPNNLSLKDLKPKKAYLTKERIELARQADFLAHQVLKKHNLMDKVWQMPVVLAPISFSGKGESVILRPIWSENVMTVEFSRLPFSVVKEMADKIYKLSGIEAVFYDVTHKPPATVEWE